MKKKKQTKQIEMDPYSTSTTLTSKLSNLGSSVTSEGSGFSFFWLAIGIVVTALIILVVYFVVGRAETRPIKQGFYGGPINGTSEIPCGRMSSEAEALVAMFSNRQLNVGEEGQQDFHDLKAVLSKMLCMKSDLMAPQHTITAVKELGFATHMDIQPVADLTARCFTKTIPERDLSIQFIKWRDFGLDMVRRLCTAADFGEGQVQQAEKLFLTAWNDAYDVASIQCLKTITDEKLSPHEAAPRTPENVMNLRQYDGYY
jgi:hypothetical protein